MTYLPWPDLDVEVISLVGYLKNLRPSEAVDSEPVPVNKQTICTNTQHDVNTFRVL